jgi:hypothetical protein
MFTDVSKLKCRLQAHPVPEPFKLRNRAEVKPRDGWRRRLTLRIDRHERLREPGDAMPLMASRWAL